MSQVRALFGEPNKRNPKFLPVGESFGFLVIFCDLSRCAAICGIRHGHRRGTYTTLLTEGRLNEYLHEIDSQARVLFYDTISRLAPKRGIDENLKAQHSLKSTAGMNAAQQARRRLFSSKSYTNNALAVWTKDPHGLSVSLSRNRVSSIFGT